MTLPALPLLLLAIALGGEDPPAPTEASVLRMYDVSALADDLAGYGNEERLYPMSTPTDLGYAIDTGPELADVSDDVAMLVQAAFPGEFEYEGRAVTAEFGRLQVFAPASVQEAVAEFLIALEDQVTPSTELTVDVIELHGEATLELPDQAVVPEARARALLAAAAGAGEVRSHRLTLSPGRTATLDISRSLQLVSDYDVEIAQGSWIFDPIVDEIAVGTRMFLRGAPVDGGVALSIVLKDGDALRGPYTRELSTGGMLATEEGTSRVEYGVEAFQTADLLGHNLALDTAIQDGHALVMAADLDVTGGASRRVVVVRRTGAALPISSAVAQGDTWSLWSTNLEAADPPTLELWGWRVEPGTGMLTTLRAHRWDEGLSALIGGGLSTGTGALLLGTPGENAGDFGPTRAIVAGPGGLSGPSAYAQGIDLVDVELVLRVAGEDAPAARVRLPIRAGTTAASVLGVETFVVHDYDVEVAQYAAVADPFGTWIFDGLLASVRVGRRADGRVVLDLSARGHLRRDEQHSVELDAHVFDVVELSAFDRLFVDERVVLTQGGEGARLVLGDAAGQVDGSLSLEVIVR